MIRNAPEASVVAVANVTPEASVRATCAPGIIAPVESATVPVIALRAAADATATGGVAGPLTCAMANGQRKKVTTRALRTKAYPPGLRVIAVRRECATV